MSDPGKSKKNDHEYNTYDFNDAREKSDPTGVTVFKDKIVGKITGTTDDIKRK